MEVSQSPIDFRNNSEQNPRQAQSLFATGQMIEYPAQPGLDLLKFPVNAFAHIATKAGIRHTAGPLREKVGK
jgi:hypothetical protein